MRTALLLIFINFILLPNCGQARESCQSLFSQPSEWQELEQLFNTWMTVIEEERWFGLLSKTRQKEIKKMKHEFSHVKSHIQKKAEQDPQIKSLLESWVTFSRFWLTQVQTFKKLSPQDKKKYKATMSLAASLSTKHLIAFLEAKNYKKWKLERLRKTLAIQNEHSIQDLEARLFLLKRQVEQYYSSWDFIHCLY